MNDDEIAALLAELKALMARSRELARMSDQVKDEMDLLERKSRTLIHRIAEAERHRLKV